MKLYTINPLFTSICSVIIFGALTSSISVGYNNGRIYLDSKYEIVYGGDKTLNIHGTKFQGLKSYRKLTADDQSKVRKRWKNIAIQEKKEQEKEKENQRRQREEEKKKDQKRLNAEKTQLEAERVKRTTEVPISQKQTTPNNIQNKKPTRVASIKKSPSKKI